MSTANPSNVKRRLAGEGRPPPEIGRMTPELALRLAVARAGDECMEMEVIATSVDMTRSVLAPLVESVEEHSLLVLLEGGDGRLGLALMNPQLMAGLIEKQTTGRVVPSAAAPRAPTRTDAIMCADFCNAILEKFHEEAQEAALPVAPALAGFRFAMALEDPRAILMALEDIPYRVLNVTVDLEKNAKEGRLSLVLPHDLPRAHHAGSASKAVGDFDAMVEIAMDTHTEMEAVLHRVEMTLAEVTALGVGAQIPVPREAVSRMGLEDIFGEKISLGRLGAKAGHRAICINLTDNPISEADFGASGQPMEHPPGSMIENVGEGVAIGEMSDLAAMTAPDAGSGLSLNAEAPSGTQILADLADLPTLEGPDAPGPVPIEAVPDLPDLPDLSDLSLTD